MMVFPGVHTMDGESHPAVCEKATALARGEEEDKQE